MVSYEHPLRPRFRPGNLESTPRTRTKSIRGQRWRYPNLFRLRGVFFREVCYRILISGNAPLIVPERCFLITHAHLDHISSLVLSTGALGGERKRVYAVKETLEDLESVFSWRIWPKLASYDENDEDYKLLYSP